MTKDAMKQALEALTYIYTETTADEDELIDKAITAIKEALSEHAMREVQRLGQEIEQEPVAWMFQHDETGRMNYVSNDGIHNPTVFLEMNPRYALVCPLYTHPPQRTWVGLTDEEREEIKKNTYWNVPHVPTLFDAIEAKLKELNT
jgi:hypothetical protein